MLHESQIYVKHIERFHKEIKLYIVAIFLVFLPQDLRYDKDIFVMSISMNKRTKCTSHDFHFYNFVTRIFTWILRDFHKRYNHEY